MDWITLEKFDNSSKSGDYRLSAAPQRLLVAEAAEAFSPRGAKALIPHFNPTNPRVQAEIDPPTRNVMSALAIRLRQKDAPGYGRRPGNA